MQEKTMDETAVNRARTAEGQDVVVPVVAEELKADTERVRTGSVRVRKTVHEHEELIDQPLVEERAEIRRVVKDEVVEGPLPVRQSGDTMIVPVVKEVLVVQKQYVLTEEIHIRTVRTEQRHRERVTVKEEQADVQRLDSRGRVVETEEAPPLHADTGDVVEKHPAVDNDLHLSKTRNILRDSTTATPDSKSDGGRSGPASRRRKKLLE
jgi:uncharacterized protein (TIGR02271 family)